MSKLTSIEQIKLENIFSSPSGPGYILDFSDRTFRDFVLNAVGKDISSDVYSGRGQSKANRLRTFWEIEDKPLVGLLTFEMLKYWKSKKILNGEEISAVEQVLYEECVRIAEKLNPQKEIGMEYEYDVAISFAGEDRTIASDIAQKLQAKGIHVFYDEFEEANLWGTDLYVHLHDVYSRKARFCIMLISKHYANKAWTNHERESAQERAFKEKGAYILPVKLDDTSIPGIRETVGYLSLRNKTTDDVVRAIMVKLGTGTDTASALPRQELSGTDKSFIPLPKIKRSFTERDRDLFIENSFGTIRAFFQIGTKELNTLDNIEADFKDITSNKFVCKAYYQGRTVSSCTIWIGSQFSNHGINYIAEANPDASNSINDSLIVETNTSNLCLKPLMNFMGTNSLYNPQEAASYYWSKFIERIGPR